LIEGESLDMNLQGSKSGRPRTTCKRTLEVEALKEDKTLNGINLAESRAVGNTFEYSVFLLGVTGIMV
jgi:hypothetical protein